MDTHDHQDKVLAQLRVISIEVAKQNSLSRMFATGIVYGVGFFVGSAIIATIALGLLGPLVGQVPWVRDSFEAGTQLLHK